MLLGTEGIVGSAIVALGNSAAEENVKADQ